MYVIELALKLTPLPLSVHRKDLVKAKALYQEIKGCMEKGHPRLVELSCDKNKDKELAVLTSEIIALQVYEKNTSTGGLKRPGFSLES